MYTTIKNRFLPYFGVLDSGKIALVVASVMGGYVLLLNNSPCIDAQSTCQIGSTNEFTGNISIAGGTSHKGTLDASNLTNDRTYTFPDQDGTFLMGSAFTGNKMIGTSPTGSLETVDTYPKTFGGVTDANKYVTLNGAGTEIIANSTTIPLADISLTTGSPNALMGIDSTNATVEYKLLSTIPLEGFDTSSATVGQFLKAGANTGVWQNIDPTVDLSVGTGSTGQILQVDSAGTGIEWANPSGGGSVSLTAKGSITGGKIVASVVDGTDLKVEQITSLQESANSTQYTNADSFSGGSRYFHYNAIADKYLQCYKNGNYVECATGSINTTTNEITWNTGVQVTNWESYIWTNGLPNCAYADNPSHNYYMCNILTSNGNDNWQKVITFSIDSTGTTIDSGEKGFQLCYGNYGNSYGSCNTGVPIWDMQTDTWVMVSAVHVASSQSGFSTDYGIVASKNIAMNSDETCNGVNCGFDNNYYQQLKQGSGSSTNFGTTYWQGVLDQRATGYNRLKAVALDNGDSNIFEYAVISKADSSGSGGGMQDGGWSAVHLERTSSTGAYSVGTPIANFNNKSTNTGTVNQFCGGNTYTEDNLVNNVAGQGTTDVGFWFTWVCQENQSYGGNGRMQVYGNFFSPNTTTNTFDLANTEGIPLYAPDSSVFGADGLNGQSSNAMYINAFDVQLIETENTLLISGTNYLYENGGTYYGCTGTYYCGAFLVTKWNTNKTTFTPMSFNAYFTSDYAYSFIVYNSDESLYSLFFINYSTGYMLGNITPTIDKNRSAWIGFLSTSASDGDAVSINIISGKATGLTGLTAGTLYFVGGDGSLVTSGDSANKFCIAISQTECLILNSNF